MICERVIIIHQGRIVAEDRIENLSNLLKGATRLRLKVQGPAAQVTESLERISSVKSVVFDDPYYFVEYSEEREPQAEINQVLMQNGWTLQSMESVELSLEDIFLKLTSAGEEATE